MIKFANEIKAMKLGNVEVVKAYLGSSQVFPSKGGGDDDKPINYADEYLTIVPTTDTFSLGIVSGVSISTNKLYFSCNGGEWKNQLATVFYKGDKIRVKAENFNGNSNGLFKFSNYYKANVYGNVNSLYHGDDFKTNLDMNGKTCRALFKDCDVIDASNLILPYETVRDSMYVAMFEGCTNLIAAPKLTSTNLGYAAYSSMFNGCTSLETAPELLAEDVPEQGYMAMFQNCTALINPPIINAKSVGARGMYQMFNQCTSLETAPELHIETLNNRSCFMMFYACEKLTKAPSLNATTLAQGCYYSMFSGCKALETAPELPAAQLVQDCYNSMFSSCDKVNYVKCLAETFATDSCRSWLNIVPNTGTFVKKKGVEWTTGTSGIPSGWTVEEVD